MIKRAKLYNSDLANVTFKKNNGYDFDSLPDNSVDLVLCYPVFGHVPETAIILSYLKDIQRVLKNDGRFLIALQKRNQVFSRGAFHFVRAFRIIPVPLFLVRLIPFRFIQMYGYMSTYKRFWAERS